MTEKIKVIKFIPEEIEIEVDKLTDAQRKYVEVIENYKKIYGKNPSMRKIAKLIGVSSVGSVYTVIENLRVKGYDYTETYVDF